MIPANYEIELSGLDGSNLLAFMAALGTVRVLSATESGMECALSWKESMGIWRPIIHSSWSNHEAIVDIVHAQLTPAGEGKGDVNKKERIRKGCSRRQRKSLKSPRRQKMRN